MIDMAQREERDDRCPLLVAIWVLIWQLLALGGNDGFEEC